MPPRRNGKAAKASLKDASPAPSKAASPAPERPVSNGAVNKTNGKATGKRGRSATPTEASKKPRVNKPGWSNPVPTPFPAPVHPNAAPSAEGKIATRSLLIWGNGDMGQLGLGTDALEEIQRPRLHAWAAEETKEGKLGKHGLAQVAAGGLHTLALDSNGTVWTWGINDNAALGRSTTRDPEREAEEFETVPTPVEGMSPSGEGIVGGDGPNGGNVGEVEKFRATRVAASNSCSVALNEAGELRVWGSFRSNDGLLGFDPTPSAAKLQFTPRPLHGLEKIRFSAVTCGEDHVLALSLQGHVWSWGNGQQSQLGRRVIERRKLNALYPSKLALRKIVTIGCGSYHSFAVDEAGKVYAWGLNTFGQLGMETSEDQVVEPQVVETLLPENHDGAKVVQVDAGSHYSLFLFDNGQVWGCGRCDGNELGLGEDHPAKIQLTKERDAWAAEREVQLQQEMKDYEAKMKAKKDAHIGTEGAFAGVLSAEDLPPTRGPPPDEYLTEPVHIPFPGDRPIAQVSAGPRYSVAVARDGFAYTWGLGQNSELGQGDEETVETPTQLKSKSLKEAVCLATSAGGQHAILLTLPRAEHFQG